MKKEWGWLKHACWYYTDFRRIDFVVEWFSIYSNHVIRTLASDTVSAVVIRQLIKINVKGELEFIQSRIVRYKIRLTYTCRLNNRP